MNGATKAAQPQETARTAGSRELRVNIDHPLGRRIAVVGGGGKTTLSKALSAKLGLPFVELDALFWKPGWQESSVEEFRSKVTAALAAAPAGWVADGNYTSRLGDLVVGQADTVIFVNMPWQVMFCRIFRRAVRRARDRERICGDNYESWRQTFFSPKSLLWWHVKTRRRYNMFGDRLLPMLQGDVPLFDLASPKLLDEFYRAQGLKTASHNRSSELDRP